MPEKPLAIDASTVLATKDKAPAVISGALQRGQTATGTLVDLNFKVPAEFRQRFKQLALDAQLKNVQLLARVVEAYEREHGRNRNGLISLMSDGMAKNNKEPKRDGFVPLGDVAGAIELPGGRGLAPCAATPQARHHFTTL